MSAAGPECRQARLYIGADPHNLSPGNFADPETLSRLQGDVSTFVKDLVFRRSGPGASLDTTRGRP